MFERTIIEGDFVITEISNDPNFTNIFATITSPVQIDVLPLGPASIEEQILAETHYQTALLEMNMMGGL